MKHSLGNAVLGFSAAWAWAWRLASMALGWEDVEEWSSAFLVRGRLESQRRRVK